MKGNVRHYFAGDHTAKGFYTLYDSCFQDTGLVYKLNGTSPAVKSKIMKQLADTFQETGMAIELIHRSSDPEELDGVILPEMKIGLVDGDLYDSAGKDVDVDTAIDTDQLVNQEDEILGLKEKIENEFSSAHASFATGLHIHDGLEEIYINQMDFAKANQLAVELNESFFHGVATTGRTSIVKHRFFGASTPQGVMDYIENLTEDLDKRYFIKGRAGTGKSTLLKKISAAAEQLGFDIEMYHCGFDPESMDMVVIRELGFCIFDSTDPHEYFPDRAGDEVVDVYEKAVTPGTDENYATAIMELNRSYKSYMKNGIAILQEAKRLHDELEHIYAAATDDSKVEELIIQLNAEITSSQKA
ncbi:PRK06851 family protein [Thalassobacillus devorans]|uniref:PRK06851 family protein n=1 Tax=Thalassobacillus devorans TaxID=279813 RepID=UPI00048F285F|nr:PRK06851 family protein [Thalassobacillus devorans]